LNKAVPLSASGTSAVDPIRSRTMPRPASPISSNSSAEAASDVPFDTSAIDKLRDLVGGEQSALAELINSYLNDTSTLLRDIHQAIEKDDAELLRRAGHSLKSSSLDFGAPALSKLGKQLEDIGKQKTTANASELLAQAEVQFEPVRVALERICRGE
jgi:HPt (histidine-containing phosphotransfer) domain-containing protein